MSTEDFTEPSLDKFKYKQKVISYRIPLNFKKGESNERRNSTKAPETRFAWRTVKTAQSRPFLKNKNHENFWDLFHSGIIDRNNDNKCRIPPQIF